ncbi:MAG TPA: hypothetical protein PKH26_12440 [Phycisphaerae bacterium]|nr:hypothetical protein [Phycisphaerae bacterium]
MSQARILRAKRWARVVMGLASGACLLQVGGCMSGILPVAVSYGQSLLLNAILALLTSA